MDYFKTVSLSELSSVSGGMTMPPLQQALDALHQAYTSPGTVNGVKNSPDGSAASTFSMNPVFAKLTDDQRADIAAKMEQHLLHPTAKSPF
jgi:hypothetical protein